MKSGRTARLVLLIGVLVVPLIAEAQAAAELEAAIRALETLVSITKVGLLYPQYVARVGETQALVDRAFPLAKPETARHLEAAMLHYRLAIKWWEAQRRKDDRFVTEMRARLDEADVCPRFRTMVRRTFQEWIAYYEASSERGRSLAQEMRDLARDHPGSDEAWRNRTVLGLAVTSLWRCAAEEVHQAKATL